MAQTTAGINDAFAAPIVRIAVHGHTISRIMSIALPLVRQGI